MSELTIPLSLHKQSIPHNLDMTQAAVGTQGFCAVLGGSFSQTVGTVGKASWKTHTVPNDSGRKTIY